MWKIEMTTLIARSLIGEEISKNLFGANLLADRDNIGPEGTYDDVTEDLGVTHVRYPGGSLTERYFDLADPTSPAPVSVVDGDVADFLPYDEFMDWAEASGLEVTIVLPTLTQMGRDEDADHNGDRYPDIDEDVLRGFIRDTLDGAYASPKLRAFEIGNEYYGSGEMSSVEYGRLASEMATIVRDEIDSHPNAEAFADTDILIQTGCNYGHACLSDLYLDEGSPEEQLAALSADYDMAFPADQFLYSNGTVSWPRVNSALIAREFDTTEEKDAVDAIVTHIYGRGLDAPNSWSFDYRVIDDAMADHFDGVTKYVTEWNTKSKSFTGMENERFGLENAHEMLNIVNEMSQNNVEAAHVWGVQQNTATDLSGDEGSTDLTVAGEMFKMMAGSMPGTYSIKLDTEDASGPADTSPDFSFHLYSGPTHSTLFVISKVDMLSEVELDLTKIFSDLGDVDVTVLGVEDGFDPAYRDAPAVVENLSAEEVILDGVADIVLDAREIMQITFDNPVYTTEFGHILPTTFALDDEADVLFDAAEEDVEELAALGEDTPETVAPRLAAQLFEEDQSEDISPENPDFSGNVFSSGVAAEPVTAPAESSYDPVGVEGPGVEPAFMDVSAFSMDISPAPFFEGPQLFSAYSAPAQPDLFQAMTGVEEAQPIAESAIAGTAPVGASAFSVEALFLDPLDTPQSDWLPEDDGESSEGLFDMLIDKEDEEDGGNWGSVLTGILMLIFGGIGM